MKAAELVGATGIEEARTIIADFAAAGLVKSYALATKTVDARGVSACVRGATIPAELWQRVVNACVGADIWTSGTVRLAGSDLVGARLSNMVDGWVYRVGQPATGALTDRILAGFAASKFTPKFIKTHLSELGLI